MTNLQKLVQQSYENLIKHADDSQIILLHPNSRYRSMVIAKLLADPPRPVYYYAMGPYDVNLSTFISGFVHDLSEQVSHFGQNLSQLGNELGQVPLDEILNRMLKDLEQLSDEPYFFVLDEYDASENANDIQIFLEYLLTNLPSHCQVIINSRTLPRLPWVALVAQQHATIISDNDVVVNDPYELATEGDLAELSIQCLGPGFITKDDVMIDDWEGHLPRLLFIFGLERPVITRSEICKAFWPNLDNDQAVNVFHVTKRRLHKALGFDALIHQDGYYQVNPRIKVNYDVVEFVGALVKGKLSSGEEAAQAWQKAIDLYKGPFLQGHTDDWILRQRDAYQTGYLKAMMETAKVRLDAGRPEHALRILVQASNESAEFEPLHREIMKLYAHLGRRSEAASHYQSLVQNLRDRGLEPAAATQTLYHELMS